ncbi:MAG: Type 1 glutamine amidotransferase-like domain-containing protein [Anaerolineales bacterium]|nr:Type 1 glutamine amidotransferase-like domain-containing protein [Anaerolineales bacterium]
MERALLEIIASDPSRLRATIVTTASVKWKHQNKYALFTKRTFDRLGFRLTDFIDIEQDDPRRLLKYDLIYLNGGNPFYLLKFARETGTLDILHMAYQRGITLVGASAGSILFGPDISIAQTFYPHLNLIQLQDLKAANLVGFTILPHYNKLRYLDTLVDERLQMFSNNIPYRVIPLSNGSGVLAYDKQSISVIGNDNRLEQTESSNRG